MKGLMLLILRVLVRKILMILVREGLLWEYLIRLHPLIIIGGNSPVKVVSSEISEITSNNLKSNVNIKEIPIDTTIAIIKHRVN